MFLTIRSTRAILNRSKVKMDPYSFKFKTNILNFNNNIILRSWLSEAPN
jgi:hypothetical protein